MKPNPFRNLQANAQAAGNPTRPTMPIQHTYPEPGLPPPSYQNPSPFPAVASEVGRPGSAPPYTGVHNNNNADGVFNHINGSQHNNDFSTTKNEHYAGDHFAGPIHGGNVGGRNNTNSIINSGSSALMRPPAPGPPRARKEPPVYQGGSYELYGMELGLYQMEKETEELMAKLNYSETQKLAKKIEVAQRLRDSLVSELGRR